MKLSEVFPEKSEGVHLLEEVEFCYKVNDFFGNGVRIFFRANGMSYSHKLTYILSVTETLKQKFVELSKVAPQQVELMYLDEGLSIHTLRGNRVKGIASVEFQCRCPAFDLERIETELKKLKFHRTYDITE